jgi:hypothetical protein
MATIRKETTIAVPADDIWEALRDWGAPHTRLAPGFVIDTRLDGDDRIVTFAWGAVVRELLVDLDDDARRLVWSVREGPYSHHNGTAQVFPDGNGGSRFVWIADVLPNETAARTAELMEQGTAVIKRTLESERATS